jgi:iron(III) transport system permease protein
MWAGPDAAPAILQALNHGKGWLWPLPALLAVQTLVLLAPGLRRVAIGVTIACSLMALSYLLAQGFAIGLRGWTSPWLAATFGASPGRQFGMGYGALLAGCAFLFLLTGSLARLGVFRGDGFTLGALALIASGIFLFVFFPVSLVLVSAAKDGAGYSAMALLARLSDGDIWSLACLAGGGACGVLWNTLLMAFSVGAITTVLGLAFALLVERTTFRGKALLRVLTIVPIITPPFVIGLAIILLFGRQGIVTSLLDTLFGIPPSRYIYGLSGILVSQVLAFTPIAFLVLIGVVQGISPSMEEAAQTLRASRLRTFFTVTLPLLRPGLASAFLLGVVESISDFGNPALLGGKFDVLATKIYVALVGVQSDPGKAAALAIVLLGIALAAFLVQLVWLGDRSYTTVAGKGDSGIPLGLPSPVRQLVVGSTVPWLMFTAAVYGMILFGGLVENFGRDHTPTLRHVFANFRIDWGVGGIVWAGGAWKSLFTTLESGIIAAPITAALGLAAAYILSRQRFAGRGLFEFVAMLSFAIPGTVIGLSYVMAFNTPPVELTGTTIILIICFIFRDMPVAIRAGIASMSQVDRSLEESSMTLRHSSFATIRRVILPLMRPALVAALVFSLVRAMTSISAIVFLVSTQHNLATAYIIERAENADYGAAISYSAVLVITMALLIVGIQFLVGERRLGRRSVLASHP